MAYELAARLSHFKHSLDNRSMDSIKDPLLRLLSTLERLAEVSDSVEAALDSFLHHAEVYAAYNPSAENSWSHF